MGAPSTDDPFDPEISLQDMLWYRDKPGTFALASFTLVSQSQGKDPANAIVTKSWDPKKDIVGLDGQKLNLRIQLSPVGGANSDSAPPSIKIRVTLLEPATPKPKMGITSTKSQTFDVPQVSGLNYAKTILFDDLPDTMAIDSILEVATARRPGSTSDKLFRNVLAAKGWRERGASVLPITQDGQGIQPNHVKEAADAKARDGEWGEIAGQPNAERLFYAGGVEVANIEVLRQPGLLLDPLKTSIQAFVRSPADIVYYTGHGATSGDLITITEVSWVKPEKLLKYWGGSQGADVPWDIDVLIFNACNTLYMATDELKKFTGRTKSVGKKWAELLCDRGGPLLAILGNYEPAPSDEIYPPGPGGGNNIARQMAEAIVSTLGENWDQYVPKWLEINKACVNFNAAGIDTNGYSYISPYGKHEIVRNVPFPST